MTSFDVAQAQDVLQSVIDKAKRFGADSADAILVDGSSLSVSWREGKLESLEQSEGGEIGLRVLIGKRQASVSTTDQRPASIDEAVERAVAMAKVAPEDPFCGIAAPEEILPPASGLELADKSAPTAEQLIALAKEAEEAVLSVSGVSQCEGAHAGGGKTSVFLAASNGFSGGYSRTNYGLSASALAGQGTAMEVDHDYASRVFFEDMPSASRIGFTAGQRAVKLLGARKMPSCQVPVVFDPREANGLISQLSAAILGSGIARGTSFLKDSLGQQVFAKGITVIDDPFRARGLRSKAFDGEGIVPVRRKIIDDGVLTSWLMDLRSARQLGLKSTGHAQRGTSGVPSPGPTNFYMEAGVLSPEDLIKDIKQGFYVTQTMGMGVNGVTGDYSLAARGFWIENGVIAFSVSEMTIASNLKDMFKNLTAANDLAFLYGIDAPTIRVEGMTVAGT